MSVKVIDECFCHVSIAHIKGDVEERSTAVILRVSGINSSAGTELHL